jgi:hypothetical protein
VSNNSLLKVTSLLSLLLLTLHVTDDIVRGISKAESSNIALVVLVVLLYGTLVLAEGRWGHVIMFVVECTRRARGRHHDPLGARTVEPATRRGGLIIPRTCGTRRDGHASS